VPDENPLSVIFLAPRSRNGRSRNGHGADAFAAAKVGRALQRWAAERSHVPSVKMLVRFGRPRVRVGFYRLAGLLLLLPATGRAEPARHLRVVAGGDCPSGLAVKQELRRLFPAIDVATASDQPGEGDAVVQEQPDGFTVALSEFRRYFEDPAARCAERAQMAAVFIAIALDPPRLPSVPAEPPPSPAPPDSGAAPPALELELGPVLQFAPGAGTQNVPLALGGGGRMRWGRTVSLSLGAALWSARALRYPQAEAAALWLPLDLGVRVMRAEGGWDAGVEASLVVAPVRLQGANLPLSAGGWRTEIGGRGSAILRRWLGDRVGVFACAYAVTMPRPYTLRVVGVGEVGNTPTLWLGGVVGVSFRIH
jgi:hypothetical protein